MTVLPCDAIVVSEVEYQRAVLSFLRIEVGKVELRSCGFVDLAYAKTISFGPASWHFSAHTAFW
jgi:hypothetical protein